jgi:hypothetical protein
MAQVQPQGQPTQGQPTPPQGQPTPPQGQPTPQPAQPAQGANSVLSNSGISNIGQQLNNAMSKISSGINSAFNSTSTTTSTTTSSNNLSKALGNNGTNINKNKAKNTTKQSTGMNANTMIEITPNMDNFTVIIGVAIGFVLLLLMFFFSKTFNVGRTVERIKMFERYQKITNYQYGKKEYGNKKLREVSILSSYNSCLNNNQMLTYVSENVLKQVIKSGARFLEFNVFGDKFGTGGEPVVSNGFKRGEWKLTMNTVPFENVIAIIADNAFKVLSDDGGAPNVNDPIFISLNLSTGYNVYCLDKIADIILDYFSERLLDPKYAYQFSNEIHNIKMRELQNKVVIFASKGFEGSKLEELVNATWTDETNVTVDNPNLMTTIETFANTAEKISNKAKKSLHKDNIKARSKSKTNGSSVASGNIEELDSEINDKLGKMSKEREIEEINKLLGDKSGINSDGNGDGNGGNVDDTETTELMEKKKEKFMSKLDNLVEVFADDANAVEDGETDDTDTTTSLVSRHKPSIIRITSKMFNKPEFNGDRIRAHNRNGLTIVVPNTEGDFFTDNHDPMPAIALGCQFICMNFQYINEAMDTYITKFEKKGIIPIEELNS